MVQFIPESHTYINEDGVCYTSGTTLVGLVKPKFNKEFWGLYKAIQTFLGFSNETEADKKVFSRYMIDTHGVNFFKKDLLHLVEISQKVGLENYTEAYLSKIGEWEEKSKASTDKGTAIHLLKENDAFKVGEKRFNSDIVGITQKVEIYPENLYDLPDGFYPEMLLWNDEEEIAGQSDCVWLTTKNGIRYAFMDDFKSNSEITVSSKYKLLPPVAHLKDCHLSHYSLQESFYMWMLEQFGFVYGGSRITHIPDGITETHYETPYLKEEVEKILSWRKKGLFLHK